MSAPSPLLLLWCGLAATLAAAIAGVIVGRTSYSWSLAPRAETPATAWAWSLAGGLLAYPLAYGVIFEVMHRADIRIGVVIGAVHGIAMFLAAGPRIDTRNAIRAAVSHVAYAATIAFLYVTP